MCVTAHKCYHDTIVLIIVHASTVILDLHPFCHAVYRHIFNLSVDLHDSKHWHDLLLQSSLSSVIASMLMLMVRLASYQQAPCL